MVQPVDPSRADVRLLTSDPAPVSASASIFDAVPTCAWFVAFALAGLIHGPLTRFFPPFQRLPSSEEVVGP